MGRAAKKIGAGAFKAKCLALLDEVAASRRELLVTKRGKPVAKVVPVDSQEEELSGLIEYQEDLVSPIDTDWDADR